MADIFREVDEDVRQERYEKLWKAYGKYLLGLAAAIILATAGYVWWQDYQRSQREDAGSRFEAALDLARKDSNAEAAAAFVQLSGQTNAGYKVLSLFQAAGAKFAAGDAAGAVALYDQIASDSDTPAELKDLAVLLAVQARLDDAPPAELEGRLAPLLGDDRPWRYSARELAALIALRAGDVSRAKESFTVLADDPEAPAGLRARAAEMLAALDGGGRS